MISVVELLELLVEVTLFTGKPVITASPAAIPRTTITKIAAFPILKPAFVFCMNKGKMSGEIKDQAKEQPVLLWRTSN